MASRPTSAQTGQGAFSSPEQPPALDDAKRYWTARNRAAEAASDLERQAMVDG